jgi:hypothetical protein
MINHNKAGLVLGSFIGLIHLIWSILVAAGWAQPLADFIYGMHFLNNPFHVKQFEIVTAVELVVITFVVGYVAGNVLALLWQKFHDKK